MQSNIYSINKKDHPLSTYAKFSEKLIFLKISENFTYVLNGWPQM